MIGKPVIILSRRIKHRHFSAPFPRVPFRQHFIIRIIHHIISCLIHQKFITYIARKTNSQCLSCDHIRQKRTVRSKLTWIDTLPVIADGKISARFHRHGYPGQFLKTFFRKKLSLWLKLFILIVKSVPVFFVLHTVHAKRKIGRLMPVL